MDYRFERGTAPDPQPHTHVLWLLGGRDDGRPCAIYGDGSSKNRLDRIGDDVEIGPADVGFGGPQPTIVFSRTAETNQGNLRLHIDVSPTDREQDGELSRLLAAGARPVESGRRTRRAGTFSRIRKETSSACSAAACPQSDLQLAP